MGLPLNKKYIYIFPAIKFVLKKWQVLLKNNYYIY